MLRYRGYISSRINMGERSPQHIQNLVIRNYCKEQGFIFLLSVTEHIMPECFMILEQQFAELDLVDGLIFYSLFQLPQDNEKRNTFYQKMLSSKKSFHFALESQVITNDFDVQRIEDIWMVKKTLAKQFSH